MTKVNPSPESSLSSSDRFLSLPNTTVVVCTVVVTRLRIMRKPGRKRSSAPGKRTCLEAVDLDVSLAPSYDDAPCLGPVSFPYTLLVSVVKSIFHCSG